MPSTWRRAPLSETLAKAVGTVWAKGEAKGIALAIHCDDTITVCHDPKWTAEALGNILDNAVKYTPAGGAGDHHRPPLAVLHPD